MRGVEVTTVPRLPAKTATGVEGIPEWDATIHRIRDHIRSIRTTRERLHTLAGEVRMEMLQLARQSSRAGGNYAHLSTHLHRLSGDMDPSDLRLTQFTQELDGIDQDYRRITDNPFVKMSRELTASWGRTLTP